ncbi:hypothetical protein KNO81_33305 [Paraburkholderia sediminicola]|uniref:hypothetical protein n=1 Tax=Paraburkholderia domus TaxID=2793075 RepID=UPI001911B438|nr:hypothetical protein [Paraburkholderia domus]MBK5046792.1 hypothetical protein [Burkholderia sp. R-70006]MCI0150753.1 hypothetical protein [Paraburkholderia sediminicola]
MLTVGRAIFSIVILALLEKMKTLIRQLTVGGISPEPVVHRDLVGHAICQFDPIGLDAAQV